ncbi:MAG: glycosyltransferase [Sedimentisphaerales bacterium]
MPARTVLYIVSTLQKGGPVRQLFNLIKYLDRWQFLPHVLTLSAEPKDSLLGEFMRIDVPVSSLGLGRLAGFIRARHLIADYIAKLAPAIVHSCGFRADLFSAGLDYSVHTVATVRAHPFEDYVCEYGCLGRFIMAPLHLKALRKIEKPVFVSRTLSEKLSKKYGIAFGCIQNGADTEIFFPAADEQKQQIRNQLGLPLKHRLFIAAGNLSQGKDPLCVAQGFLKAAIGDATMIFAGDGPLRQKLNLLCNSGKIIIAGYVKDIRPWLWASDFLVSGSHSEGLPNAVLEAMACGLGCILSDIPPHREILDYNPQAGTLFTAGNPEHLAEAIRRIMETPYDTGRQAALGIIKNHLNAQRMSSQYQALYKTILHS